MSAFGGKADIASEGIRKAHFGGTRPSEADNRRDREIAEEVVDVPTEPCAGLPIDGAQMGEHEQGDGGDAAKFHENRHYWEQSQGVCARSRRDWELRSQA